MKGILRDEVTAGGGEAKVRDVRRGAAKICGGPLGGFSGIAGAALYLRTPMPSHHASLAGLNGMRSALGRSPFGK